MSDSVVSKMKIVMARVAVFFAAIAWWCVPYLDGAVACYQLQLVLPSFWHLSWPVGSTPITHRERRQRQLSQKRQHCIHYIASCSLDDGLHRKKTPAWLSVYISLAGRRTAGSQQRPLAAVDVSEAAVGASIHFRRRTSKQTNKTKEKKCCCCCC